MDSGKFAEILCAWGWWDCPRSGVTMIDGQPHRFDCQFSDELDDYPAELRVWPIGEDQLEAELAAWQQWVDWRGRFDRGERVEPFENQPGVADVLDRLKAIASPPDDAGLAIPEWKLDPDRSFAGRVPRHRVRWKRPPR